MPAKNNAITVIGSSNVDFIMRLEHLPAVGETVTNGQFAQTFGGKGANQAVAAARCGGQTTFVTALGRDGFGDQIVDNFTYDNINTDFIVRTDVAPSGSALVMFDRDGNNYLSVAPGANYQLSPAHIEACRNLIAHSAMLVMQMEIPVETIQTALNIAQDCDTPVLFNFAPARSREIAVSSQIHGLVVNEIEAAELTGQSVGDQKSALRAAREFLERGPEFVIVTLGAKGVVWARAANQGHITARAVEAVDTTAAGDTFCGALAVALVEGRALPDAIKFASAAAALTVMKMGAQSSIPTRAAVDAFLDTP